MLPCHSITNPLFSFITYPEQAHTTLFSIVVSLSTAAQFGASNTSSGTGTNKPVGSEVQSGKARWFAIVQQCKLCLGRPDVHCSKFASQREGFSFSFLFFFSAFSVKASIVCLFFAERKANGWKDERAACTPERASHGIDIRMYTKR